MRAKWTLKRGVGAGIFVIMPIFLLLSLVFYLVEVAPRAFGQSMDVTLGERASVEHFDVEISAEGYFSPKATEDPFFTTNLQNYHSTCDTQLGTTGTPIPILDPIVFVVNVEPNDPQEVCIPEGETRKLDNVTVRASNLMTDEYVISNLQGTPVATNYLWWQELEIEDNRSAWDSIQEFLPAFFLTIGGAWFGILAAVAYEWWRS